MSPDTKSQDQAVRKSGDTSLEWALLRNVQLNRKVSSLPLVSPFLFQQTQPISVEKLREILQAALDLTSSDDFDLDIELDEEFEALERSIVG
jgi:hypothetical protein